MAKKKGDPKTPEEIQKEIEGLMKKYKGLNELLEDQRTVWGSINEAIFKINENDYFVKLKRSKADSDDIAESLKNAGEELQSQALNIQGMFSKAIDSYKDIDKVVNKDFAKGLDELAKKNALMATSLRESLLNKDITTFLNTFGKEGMEAFQKIVSDEKGYKNLKKFFNKDAIDGLQKQKDLVDDLNKKLKSSYETIFSWRKAFISVGEYMTRAFTPKNILPKLYEFDQVLNDTQKDFGLAMDDNKGRFTDLIGKSQIFGMGAKENAQLMGQLGESLRTTNFGLLSQAAEDMRAIHQATGLSVDEVGQLGTQLMFYGKTSAQVAKFTENTMKLSQSYGLNTKKVLQEVTKALPDSRKLGWQGGEKALAAMVVQAQKLGQTVDDLANSSKKLRTLESSLEAAADLALVGVNVNAVQMLGAARRGGKEFANFIGDITKGIGQIKKDGSVDFDPIDVDRLQVISDSIGIPIEKLQDQVAKTAQRNAKIDLFPSSLFGGLDEKEKEFLLNASSIGENGEIKLDAKILGTKDLSQVSKSLIDGAMINKKSLEAQAEANTSFKDSVQRFKDSLYNMFTIFQPMIETLTGWVQGLNSILNKIAAWGNGFGKYILATFLGAGAIFFAISKNYLAGYWMGQGFNTAVNSPSGGFFSKLKNAALGLFKKSPGTVTGGSMYSPAFPEEATKAADKSAKGTSSFAKALKAMPSASQILSLAVALVALGAAFVGIGYGIKLASEGLSELVKAFNGITNASAALGAVVAVMGGFMGMLAMMPSLVRALGKAGADSAYGLLAVGAAFVGIGTGIMLATKGISDLVKSFDGITNATTALGASLVVMASFVGMLYLFPPLVKALGIAGTEGAIGLLAVGAAFVGMGYGIKLAADGLTNLVTAFNGITNAGAALGGVIAVMGGFVGMLYAIIPAITALGAAAYVTWPGILALGAAFVGIGFGIKLASDGLSNLVKSFAQVKDQTAAMWSVVAVMGGFALAAYAMAPAITAIGAAGTVGAIGLLAIGIAFVGMGYGIKLASDGLSNLVISFAQVKDQSAAMWSVVAVMGSFAIAALAMAPAIAAIGAAGTAGAIGLLAIGAAFIGMGYGIKLASDGISNMIKSLNGIDISVSKLFLLSAAFLSLAPSILAFGGASLISAPGIAALAFSLAVLTPTLTLAVPVLEKLSKINSDGLKNVGKSIAIISTGLMPLAGIGILSIPILIGVGVLSAIAGVLPKVVASFALLNNINIESFNNLGKSLMEIVPSLSSLSVVGILAGPILIGSTIIYAASKLLSLSADGFDTFSNVNWTGLEKAGAALNNLLPNFIEFGFKSIVAAPGIWLMNSTISSLAETMERLANPMDVASKSIGSMADNIQRLKTSIQGLDTTALNNLAVSSEKFVNYQVPAQVVVAPVTTESNKPQKVSFDPIVINLKLNGRELQEIIVKDTAYHI